MNRKRSAKSLVRQVQAGQSDCDSALEEHLDNYRGPFRTPSFSKLHLALAYSNMGWGDRVLELRDGPMTVAGIIQEFGLEPFLPVFDQQEDAPFKMGDVVRYGNDSWGSDCRLLGRRKVTPFAMLRLDDWEVFIEALDGTNSGFVGESEIGPLQAVGEEVHHER